MTYLLVMGSIKVSHYHCVGVYICFHVLQSMFDGLALGAYRLIIAISFWCISPFISMECPLSHLINVSLKFPLSKISIVICTYFGGPLPW
jgi:hypothetical protein